MNATLDQRRARHAWNMVSQIVNKHMKSENGKRKPDEIAKKYGGQAKKLPVRIMTAGLGQALAFIHSKDYAPELLKDIADWVLDKRGDPESKRPRPQEDALIQSLIQGNADFLRRTTDETLAYLQWLIRFAEAEGLTESEGD